jgi:hypothetical protein
MANTVRVNPELYSLIPPLSADEYAQLEANILQDGCRDPLIVWAEEQTLLDGHTRRTICEQHGLAYTCQAISLPDLDAAKAWMIANQLGRRNLTPEQTSYYRGGQYNLQKRQGKRTDLTSGQSDQKSQNAAEQLAQQHAVSEKTIRRDAVFAKAVDTLAEVVGPEARQAVLGRETKVTQQEVRALAKMATQHGTRAQEALAAVKEAKTPKQARQIVRDATRKTREYDEQIASIIRSTTPEDELPAEYRAVPQPPVEEQAWDAVYDAELERALRKAITSLDALHSKLIGNAPDWYTKHLPEALGRNLPMGLTLCDIWHRVESLLMDHETLHDTLYRPQTLVPMIEVSDDPRVTAEALFDRTGEAYTRAILCDLQGLFAPAPAPAPPVAPKPVQEDTLIMRVWRFVQEHQPCTNAQVRQGLEIPRNQAFNILKMLVKQGKVRKDGEQYLATTV